VASNIEVRRRVYPLLGLRPCVCRSGLAGKPFTKQFRLHLPRKRSGHEGVQDAVQPAWNDSGAVFAQTAEALRYALLDAHRFHGADAGSSRTFDSIHAANNAEGVLMQSAAAYQGMNFFSASMMGRSLESDSFAKSAIV
jgi:hypothetical protein